MIKIRYRKTIADKEDGLFRWDESTELDPTKVCFTCKFFNRDDEDKCTNLNKQFFSEKKDSPNYRKIYSPKNVRCINHEKSREITFYQNSSHKDSNIEEIKTEINDLENELSLLKDCLKVKEKYGPFTKINTFSNQKENISEEIKNEIDLDILYHKYYKDLNQIQYQVDHINFKKSKVYKNTVNIVGKLRKYMFNDPIHHSILNLPEEVIKINIKRKFNATFYKNGEFIVTSPEGFYMIMKDKGLLDNAIKTKEEMNKIFAELFLLIKNAYMKTKDYFMNANVFLSYLFLHSFSFPDLNNFKVRLNLLKNDNYRKLYLILFKENNKYKFKIESDNVFTTGEFIDFYKYLKKNCEDLNIEYIIDDLDKQMIQEIMVN